jgi:tetratricopeptide (TPR) repeat protein
MTLRLPTFTAVLLAAVAAFGATFLVLRSGSGDIGVAPSSSTGSIALPSASTDERIGVYQRLVRTDPADVDSAVLLAGAYAQKVRETGDAALYLKADALLRGALARKPDDIGALTQMGALALSRHDFAGGLKLAQHAHALAPDVVKPYGVIVDALVELGRYGAAGRVLQRYVDLQPTLSSYTRVSYFRELHGDLPGAVDALQRAASAGGEAAENVAYVQTLLGNLYFTSGRLGPAEHAFREAVARFGGYPAAEAGLARVQAARGDLDAAARRLRGVVARLPLPEHIVALGEVELAQGRPAAARRDLALVGAEQRLLAAAGVNTDVDLALFEAQHGSPAKALRLARSAWAAAPSIRSADALGWALTRSGRPADGLVWGRRALRLGSRDPLLAFHAGIAAREAGHVAEARHWLARSLALNPRFSPYYAPMAHHALEAIS